MPRCSPYREKKNSRKWANAAPNVDVFLVQEHQTHYGTIMQIGINQSIVMGYLGKKPKIIDIKKQKTKVSNLIIGINKFYYKKNSKKKIFITEWVEASIFGSFYADLIEKWTDKGSLVYVQGELVVREYTAKGKKIRKTFIQVKNESHKFFIVQDGREEKLQSLQGVVDGSVNYKMPDPPEHMHHILLDEEIAEFEQM